MKGLAAILILFGFLLSNFALAQEMGPPGTIEKAKEMGKEALETTKEELPGIIGRIWKEEVLPVWQIIWDWAKDIFESTWQRIASLFGQEVEKRKPAIKEEFQKEKQELKEEVPKVSKSLWERFKELIR